MAQQNPNGPEYEHEGWTATTIRAEGGLVTDNQPREPFSQHRPSGTTVRSSPIAIIRTPENQGDDDSSYEEDGDSAIETGMDSLQIAGNDRASSRSLPSHLLRAPRLGSVPSNNIDYWIDRHPTMLPPAAKSGESTSRSATRGGPSLLSGGNDRNRSYGSLRDSHMRGRFLDGPSSYRDRTTGDIRSLQHRVRFQEGSVPSSLPASLSIGERIMNSRKQQSSSKEGDSRSGKDKGSLTALLEAADTDPGDATQDIPFKAKTPTFFDEEEERRLPSHMLSTSLTGLEILQAGLREGHVAAGDQDAAPASHFETPSLALFENAETLSLDARGHNALLSRSTSDPLPQGHLRASGAIASPLFLSMQNSNPSTPRRNNVTANSDLPSSNVPPPLNLDFSSLPATAATTIAGPLFQSAAIARTASAATYQIQVHDRPIQGGSQLDAAAVANTNAHPIDHDPDTDFAFDLEME